MEDKVKLAFDEYIKTSNRLTEETIMAINKFLEEEKHRNNELAEKGPRIKITFNKKESN